MCLQSKTTHTAPSCIIQFKTQVAIQSEHRLAKEVRVPGHVHVPHHVDVAFQNLPFNCLGQFRQINVRKLRHALGSIGNMHELLSDVLTVEKTNKRLGSIFDSFDDIFLVFDFS